MTQQKSIDKIVKRLMANPPSYPRKPLSDPNTQLKLHVYRKRKDAKRGNNILANAQG